MGKIIVIDGLDGSGKATQANILFNKLQSQGYNVHKISFPAYESPSSGPVKMYLNGEIGQKASELSPYVCSTFYTVDRAIQYMKDFKYILEQEDSLLICDRYISANIIHQGGKIKDIEERKKFFKWVYEFEVGLMGIPKEEVTIFLELPVWKSQKLMSDRYLGDENKKDIHESDIEYLNMCYESSMSAIDILNNEGHRWELINCLNSQNELRTREDISNNIMNIVKTIIN